MLSFSSDLAGAHTSLVIAPVNFSINQTAGLCWQALSLA